jgi:hypothetical protein
VTDVAVSPTVGRRVPVVAPLARQEGGRLLRHPVTVLAFAVFVLELGLSARSEGGPREAFETVVSLPSFFPGVLMILAANLVATRDLRARSGELLDSLPSSAGVRTAGLLVAGLAPAAACLVGVLGLDLVLTLRGEFVESPDAWQVMQGPVTVLGACALGTMVGRWVTAPPAVLVVMVGVVAANLWLSALGRGALFGPMFPWVRWGTQPEEWAGTLDGSSLWHVVYLLALCALAACGALLRDVRRPSVVLASCCCLVLVASAGFWQLP